MNRVVAVGVGLVSLVFFMGGLSFERFVLGKHALKEERSQIALEIQTSQEITPKAYSTHLIFSSDNALLSAQNLSSDQEESIKDSFDQINKLAKQSRLCQETTYSLRPNYTFGNGNKQALTGYKLYAGMDCSFKASDLSKYEALRDKISKIATKSALFVLNTPALFLKAEDSDYALLQAALLKKAQDQADFFGQKLSKHCSIKDLSFYEDHNISRLTSVRADTKRRQDMRSHKMTLTLMARLVVGC